MKKRMLLAAIALTALVCTVAMVANATPTNSCLKFLWAGPMGPSDPQGHVEVTFYTAHTWLDCDCAHEPGTIGLQWRYAGQSWPETWLTMDQYVVLLCEATCYDRSFTVNHQSVIDVRVKCSTHEDCQLTMLGWGVP